MNQNKVIFTPRDIQCTISAFVGLGGMGSGGLCSCLCLKRFQPPHRLNMIVTAITTIPEHFLLLHCHDIHRSPYFVTI